MAEFYSARGWEIPPLPWTNLSPPFSIEIRAYLAERWSRSQPKEAALDYMADGVWQDHREGVREGNSRSIRETRGEPLETHPVANDNALARIARDIRRTAFGWRHAQTAASFVDGRRQVLAAYDELRERTRAEGHSVALTGTFSETLTRHAVLLKQSAAFRARPDEFASLLAQRGGIGRKDLDAFEELHARARRHRRAATMRHVHRIKWEAEQQGVEPEMRQGETASVTPAERIQPVRPRHDSAQSRAHPETPNTPPVAAARKRRGTREAVLVCALYGIAPGLEHLHRRRPASWYPYILRQGVCGHDPAHPGAGGEPGCPGRNTGAHDAGFWRITSVTSRRVNISRITWTRWTGI